MTDPTITLTITVKGLREGDAEGLRSLLDAFVADEAYEALASSDGLCDESMAEFMEARSATAVQGLDTSVVLGSPVVAKLIEAWEFAADGGGDERLDALFQGLTASEPEPGPRLIEAGPCDGSGLDRDGDACSGCAECDEPDPRHMGDEPQNLSVAQIGMDISAADRPRDFFEGLTKAELVLWLHRHHLSAAKHWTKERLVDRVIAAKALYERTQG